MTAHSHEITQLLNRLGEDSKGAYDRLMALLYDELRRLAEHQIQGERADHTLQATALVHEAYLRLVGQDRAGYQSRLQFLRVAGMVMRRILIDHARGQSSQKRSGSRERVDLSESIILAEDPGLDLVAFDDALKRLAELDPRKVRIVEMRYFAGMTVQETADALELSTATVKRDWNVARLWLTRELEGDAS